MTVMNVETIDDKLPIQVFDGDLDDAAFERALDASVLAWDIETTGLDWRVERIATVQIQVEDVTYVARVNGHTPHHLKALMEDQAILKILHHAMFDLRFLAFHWNVTPANVACTKIASKLLDPDLPSKDHSLAPLVRRCLGVDLDKNAQTSDWTGTLSRTQLDYAANDVRYLWKLYECLDQRLRDVGLLDLRNRCYAHLPTRVELEVKGFPDVFAY
jgi:ribonuclease D